MLFSLLLISTTFALELTDIQLNPASEVEAGRALLITVKIENYETIDNKSVKLTTLIPKLDISSSTYFDSGQEAQEAGEEQTFLRIPSCTKPGEYKINIEVAYSNKKVTEERTINILDGGTCDDTETAIVIPRCPSVCGRNLSSGECICPSNYGFCYDNVGLRDIINNTEVYCDNELWQVQKEDNQTCKNNFECLSNFCSKGYCYDIYLEVEETKSILLRILDWLKNIFNLGVK